MWIISGVFYAGFHGFLRARLCPCTNLHCVQTGATKCQWKIDSWFVISFNYFRYLWQLSATLHVGTSLPNATLAYLRKRVEGLSPRERLVAVIIDEVYSARQVEYMNGRFFRE
jgi:hypothetical protein